MRVMAVVAHADDEVLGCGGALAKHVHDGDQVRVIYMTKVRDSRGPVDEYADELERSAALSVLGITESVVYHFPDQMLDGVGLLKLTKVVEEERDKYKPELVYIHHPADSNIDHRIMYQACEPAFRFSRCDYLREIRIFAVDKIPCFVPNLWVGIDIERKAKALHGYESEIRKWPDGRSAQAVMHLAGAYGIGKGGYSEAFESFRIFPCTINSETDNPYEDEQPLIREKEIE